MKVDDVLGFDEYWEDARFSRKKPKSDGELALRCGDNVYEPMSNRKFRQLPCLHSDRRCPSHENAKNKAKDLSGKHVLVSKEFTYFGSKPRNLPHELNRLIVARGYRCCLPDEVVAAFLSYTKTIDFGVYAEPRKWKPGNDSWRRAAGARLIKA
jgi:hypothetical protein